MTKSPPRYRPTDALSVAEAVFKPVIPTADEPAKISKPSSPPVGKEVISVRIDRDVLGYFQEEGPGWQERINAALRKSAGL